MIRYLIKAVVTTDLVMLDRLYNYEKSNIFVLLFEIIEVIENRERSTIIESWKLHAPAFMV